MVAATKNYADVALVLVEGGATVDCCDDRGRTVSVWGCGPHQGCLPLSQVASEQGPLCNALLCSLCGEACGDRTAQM
jgi:hypothetical protein